MRSANVLLMCKWGLFVCAALAMFCAPGRVYAQFTEAHHYDNTPVGTNQIELAYAYARANASIDASLIVAGAKFNLNQGSVAYTRYFGFLHHLVWVDASVPLAGLGGSIGGTNIHGSIAGAGDSSYSIAALLKGGPALNVQEFSNFKPTTTIGLSLTISAPTGSYDANKLLNLGSDRWSFKPELAISHPFGPDKKWQADLYGYAYFFTDNTSFRGVQILRQEPLPGLEGHLSYSFLDSLWASVDGLYSFRGETVVNGIYQNNTQRNFTLGTEANVSVNSRNSLVFQFAKAVVHQNGPNYTGFAVKYTYTWGRGYK